MTSSNSPNNKRPDDGVLNETVALAEPVIARDAEQIALALAAVDPQVAAVAESQVMAEWNVGDVILQLYEVKRVHERGGMGLVYHVYHRGWNVDLAVKSPRPNYFQTETQKDNFSRECETWVNLGLHPHIVSCHYVRTLGGIPRVFAEYVAGGSLKDWIDNRKLYEGGPPQALKRILDVAIQMAWGLDHAHRQERGLIHQDVKPGNVMLMPDGTAKITDFGLARARAGIGKSAAAAPGRTVFVSAGGMSPAYCSPEQARGDPLSRKTDIWSWAVSLLEMLVGEVCWPSGTVAATQLEHLKEVRVQNIGIPEPPPELLILLKQCFATDPASRPEDFRAVATSLRSIYRSVFSDEYFRELPDTPELQADGLNNRALSLLDLGRPVEASQLFNRALTLDGYHLAATFNRALLGWRAGLCVGDDVLRSLHEIEDAHTDEADFPIALGCVRMESGDFREALSHFEVAKKLETTSEINQWINRARELLARRAGECVGTLKGHTAGVGLIGFSNDDCAAFSSASLGLKLWDRADVQGLRDFRPQIGSVRGLALSPNGTLALALGDDHKLHVFETTHGRCLRSLEGSAEGASSLAISADGRTALSGKYNEITVWDIDTARPTRSILGQDHLRCLAFAPTGPLFLTGSGQDRDKKVETLKLWDSETGQCVRVFDEKVDEVVTVAISPDGSHALSGNYDGDNRHCIKLWDVATGRCVREFLQFGGSDSHITSVAFSPDGRHAVCGRWEGIQLWDTATGQCLSGGSIGDPTLRLWDVTTAKCLRVMTGQPGSVSSVAFSPNGRFVLSGNAGSSWNRDHCVRLWDIATGQCLRVLEGHQEDVHSVAFSPNGLFALSTSGRKYVVGGGVERSVRLWELSTGRCVREFEGHEHSIDCAKFSPDGRFVLSGGEKVQLWDTTSGSCVRTFDISACSLAFSPDGRFFVAASGKSLTLWELDWDYELPEGEDWDENARPYLANFLGSHTPYLSTDPAHAEFLVRRGRPSWNHEDRLGLQKTLRNCGYGWLSHGAVSRELERMKAQWGESSPLSARPGAVVSEPSRPFSVRDSLMAWLRRRR